MRKFDLQLFADDGEGGSGSVQGGSVGNGNGSQGTSAGGTGNHATYSYEQAEEIANARAQRAEQSALRSYFQQQGMTQEEVTQALNDYRERQRANKPDVAALQSELAAEKAKTAQYENEKVLAAKGVKADDLDYVAFKVNQLVTDKKDFKTAADDFLKANPRFLGQTYKVSTGTSEGNASGGTESKNEQMNNMIRNAFRR